MTQQITAQLLKGGLTVDASGNVTATGRFSGPTQKTGTIKAQDGTTAITIADSTGKVTLAGDLIVSGTTTTINSTTLTVDDKNIELGSVDTPSDTTADGGGITLRGATDKTFNWVDSTDAWTSSEHINLASGKTFQLNGTAISASAAELNLLDGVTSTTTELNYTNGVTSAIQTQMDAKAPLASPTFTDNVIINGSGETNLKWAEGGIVKWRFVYDNGSNKIVLRDEVNSLNSFTIEDAAPANSLYIKATSGNVGIGTDSPSGSLWDENANVLHIYKNSVNGGLLKLESSNTKGFLHAGNDNVYLGSITSDPVGIFTNSIRRMTIDSSGHVGIGATSLDHALQVKTPGSGADFLRFETDGSHGCKPKIQFDSGLGGTNYAAKSTIQGGYDSGQGGSGGYLAFSTKNTSETLLTRMTIDSSGNVLPGANDSYSLGSTSLRWQNIWTNDLHLVNERGDWTVIEEEDYLTLRNNKTNKMFKIVMEEL